MGHRKSFKIQDESNLFIVGVFPTSGGTLCCISEVCAQQDGKIARALNSIIKVLPASRRMCSSHLYP